MFGKREPMHESNHLDQITQSGRRIRAIRTDGGLRLEISGLIVATLTEDGDGAMLVAYDPETTREALRLPISFGEQGVETGPDHGADDDGQDAS